MSNIQESQVVEPVISINNLKFSIDGLPILEDVNLSVESGDFLAVLDRKSVV